MQSKLKGGSQETEDEKKKKKVWGPVEDYMTGINIETVTADRNWDAGLLQI